MGKFDGTIADYAESAGGVDIAEQSSREEKKEIYI